MPHTALEWKEWVPQVVCQTGDEVGPGCSTARALVAGPELTGRVVEGCIGAVATGAAEPKWQDIGGPKWPFCGVGAWLHDWMSEGVINS